MSDDNGIMQGMKEAAIFAMFKDVKIERIIELAEAERENRLTVYNYPNCYECPRLPKTNIWQDDEPCKSCRARALAATEPKGDAT